MMKIQKSPLTLPERNASEQRQGQVCFGLFFHQRWDLGLDDRNEALDLVCSLVSENQKIILYLRICIKNIGVRYAEVTAEVLN